MTLPPDRPHHINGGSTWERRYNCAGSRAAEQKVIDEYAARGETYPSSPDADRGTMLHAAVTDDDAYSRLSLDDQTLVEFVRDFYRTRWPSVAAEEWIPEDCLPINLPVNDPPYTYLDLSAFTSPDTAAIVEFKFGRDPVTPVHRNWQVVSAVIALHQRYPGLRVIEAAIPQPLATREVAVVKFTGFDVLEKKATAMLLATEAPDAPRQAGPWCKYCKAKTTCQTYTEQYSALVPADLTSAVITPETARDAYRQVLKIEQVCKQARERIKSVVIAAGGVIGEKGDGLRVSEPEKVTYAVADFFAAFQDLITSEEALACTNLVKERAFDLVAPKMVAAGLAESATDAKEKIVEKLASVAKTETSTRLEEWK